MADLAAPLPIWRRMLANGRVVWGGGFLLFLVLVAVLAPLLAPHDPLEQDLMLQYVPPFWADKAEPGFVFGADNLGRDILSRLIYGSQIALVVSIAMIFNIKSVKLKNAAIAASEV